MDGVSQNGHGPARPVGPRRRNCKAAHSFVQSSCIWYYWECLMQREATDVPMSTSITLRQNWRHHPPEQLLHAASLSLYPQNMAAIKDWCKRQYPALACILWTPWTMAGMPAAPKLWTHWTSMPSDSGAGSWEPSTHVKYHAWPRTLHITRLRCLGRRVRWWRCRPRPFHGESNPGVNENHVTSLHRLVGCWWLCSMSFSWGITWMCEKQSA